MIIFSSIHIPPERLRFEASLGKYLVYETLSQKYPTQLCAGGSHLLATQEAAIRRIVV
jgi:hypothetical protein